MTDLLIGLSSPTFNGVSSVSKASEVVFRTPGGAGQLFRNSEMRHSRSEDLLGPATNRSPSPPPVIAAAASEDDLVAASALSGSSPRASCSLLGPRAPGSPGMIADRVDPEDSIRDIVTENDLYRFVLFKRHYDKYVALATRYEEARGLAYYLEERYHEVKNSDVAAILIDEAIDLENQIAHAHRYINYFGMRQLLKHEAIKKVQETLSVALQTETVTVECTSKVDDGFSKLVTIVNTEVIPEILRKVTGLADFYDYAKQAERDKLEETRQQLERRLEGCEAELKDKEEELFLQLERSLRLEDEVERARQEREACLLARERLEREQASALRQLQIQAAQNEITRRSLERARQEVIRQATVIRAERDALERENEALKEKLRVEQDELGEERRRNEEGVAALTHEATTLRHAARHLRAAALHATSCRRRRRCSVCLYARRTFQDVDDFRDDGKLFKCLQAPIQDLRTWLRPSTPAALPPLRTSSPLERGISYIDDSATSSEDEAYSNTQAAEVSLSSTVSSAPPTARAFSSDSGFSSETGDRRSRSYECGGSSRKISESSSSEPGDALGQQSQRAGAFTRSRWTSSFRKLLGRKSKAKANATAQPESSI